MPFGLAVRPVPVSVPPEPVSAMVSVSVAALGSATVTPAKGVTAASDVVAVAWVPMMVGAPGLPTFSAAVPVVAFPAPSVTA